MPSTHLSLHYYPVFSTKNREPWLPPTPRARVHEYIGGVVRGMNSIAHAVGGTADHMHVFGGLRATHCLANVMREVKSESSAGFTGNSDCPASHGRRAMADLRASSMEKVRAYVLNKEEHHARPRFRRGYVAMLRRGLVEYDERYL